MLSFGTWFLKMEAFDKMSDIEKAAQALWKTVNERAVKKNISFVILPWDALPEFAKDEFREDVKVVIESLRETSEAFEPSDQFKHLFNPDGTVK